MKHSIYSRDVSTVYSNHYQSYSNKTSKKHVKLLTSLHLLYDRNLQRKTN